MRMRRLGTSANHRVRRHDGGQDRPQRHCPLHGHGRGVRGIGRRRVRHQGQPRRAGHLPQLGSDGHFRLPHAEHRLQLERLDRQRRTLQVHVRQRGRRHRLPHLGGTQRRQRPAAIQLEPVVQPAEKFQPPHESGGKRLGKLHDRLSGGFHQWADPLRPHVCKQRNGILRPV